MRSFRLLAVAVVAIVLAMLPLSHAAMGVVDQKQELDSGTGPTIWGAQVGQEFVPSLSPLIGIDVHIMTANPGAGYDTITLNIRESSIGPPLGGALLSTTTSQSLPYGFSGWLHFDLPSPVAVTPGSTYVIELTEATTMFGWYLYTQGDVYPNGRAISGGSFYNNIDFTFRTYAPSGTPVGGFIEPVNTFAVLAPWLAIIGLVGIGTVVVVAGKRET